MSMFLWIVLLIINLGVLVYTSDKFINIARKLGLALGLSTFAVGLTILASGTSLPELITSLIAVVKSSPSKDTTDFVLSNVIGSNIANILLIIGIVAIIAGKLEIKKNLIRLNLIPLLLATFLLSLMAYDGKIIRAEAILLLLSFGLYLKYTFSKKLSPKLEIQKTPRPRFKFKDGLSLILAILLIYLSAKLTIEAVIKISELLEIGVAIITASAVALGTSLPELVVSILAVKKKQSNLALGTITGSNIFNALFVVGAAGLAKPLAATTLIINLLIPFMLIATILYMIVVITRRLYYYEGIIYLIIYSLFLGKLFNLF